MDARSLRLEPLTFAGIVGWAEDDHAAAFRALLRSLREPSQLSSGAVSRALRLGKEVSCADARSFFESHYVPHAIAAAASQGFVTGYYEPEVKGSLTASARYTIPVYRRPGDLVSLIGDVERAKHNDRITGARRVDGDLVPYFTRAEIEDGVLAGRGLELLYLADPVELFYAQVQGSMLVRLDDGGEVRLSYDGKNGHPYTSIGRLLIERGEIAPAEMSMAAVKAWLRADAARCRALLQENRSYIFFRELSAEEGEEGPLGAQGVPLFPGRSLAVDGSLHTLGTPVFVTAGDMRDEAGTPFRRLMIAQDVGSAIRGPERGDIFWGSGEKAGEIAGSTRHAATFIVLLPRS